MTSARPYFRFGVEMMGPFDGRSWVDSVRELEQLGYSTLFVPDHFDEGFGPISALASAAMVTTDLQLATMVLAADFRHPAVLARELASIDQLSGGRLEVGIGAGYQVNDYRPTGIRMDEPRIRVDRMIEHVKVLKGLLSGDRFSFSGDHYEITGLECVPHPMTPGGPPILVAGGGKRMLTFAGKSADIVGVNGRLPTSEARSASPPDTLPQSIDEKLEWVKRAAGSRFDDLTIHAWLRFAQVTSRAREEADALGGLFHASAEDVLSSPIVLIGDVGGIVDRLHERYERWRYSYFTVQQPVAREFAAVIARLNG